MAPITASAARIASATIKKSGHSRSVIASTGPSAISDGRAEIASVTENQRRGVIGLKDAVEMGDTSI